MSDLTTFEIEQLIKDLEKGNGKFDYEAAHGKYDDVLERFCLRPTLEHLPLIAKLIQVRKKVIFHYA